MSVWRLKIAYDGSGFRGWAKQPGQRTVQGELEAALATVLRQEVPLTVAGRTDAGVHAWGQVASFELPDLAPRIGEEPSSGLARRLRRSLNAITPPEIAVLQVAEAAEGFNARHSALSRLYCYRVEVGSPASPFERGRALWWPYPIDREALNSCARALPGNHDFTAFTPTQTDHVRFDRDVLAARWEEEPRPPGSRDGAAPVLAFWVEADAFMRSMVRILAGTMLEVAGGRRSVEDFTRLLAGAPRAEAGDTAPPHGLYLAAIRYPEELETA